MTDAFFTKHATEADLFFPTDHCRGPWSVDHCHAGPPTGLLARAIERALPHQRLTRITLELLRPIPFEGFFVRARVLREGRTVSLVEADIESLGGQPVVSARGLLMTPATSELQIPVHASELQVGHHYGTPEDAVAGPFPIKETLHDLPAFNGSGVSTRYLPGHDSAPGPTCAWLKTVPLFEDEEPSPFQRICPLADCGNAFGRLAEPQELTFMNTDLTLSLFRDPEGQWMGIDAACSWEPTGVGLSESRLFDKNGVVGVAFQTLLLR